MTGHRKRSPAADRQAQVAAVLASTPGLTVYRICLRCPVEPDPDLGPMTLVPDARPVVATMTPAACLDALRALERRGLAWHVDDPAGACWYPAAGPEEER